MKISDDKWYKRIQSSRTRRDKYLDLWSAYARLHTNAYQAVADKNDDRSIDLPNGDQIKAGAIHRNIEQTCALMDVPEIGIRAAAQDFTAELGAEDTHRESIVEMGLLYSMSSSGFLTDSETVDFQKRDGFIIGHGINYSGWRSVEREVDGPAIPRLVEIEDGSFTPMLDEDTGAPMFEQEKVKETVYESVQDSHVSPTEFLCSSTCRTLFDSPWHGWERVVDLDELKADSRYDIPADVLGTAFNRTNIYGVSDDEDSIEDNSVKLITVWDKLTYKLIHFIEYTAPSKDEGGKKKRRPPKKNLLNLIKIYEAEWPVIFSHPDHSPFTFFVPVPANDLPFGISQIEHIRNQAVEKDKIRTRMANITRQIKNIFWFNKNRLNSDDLDAALKSPDMKGVGLDIQPGEKPTDLLGSLPAPNIHPDIYRQAGLADDDVNRTSGIPEVPFTGADTATESENQMAVGGARPKRKKRIVLKFMGDVASRHRDLIRAFGPQGRTMVVPAADGTPLTLNYGREAFEGDFDIKVLPGGEALTVSPVKQKTMLEAAGMMLGKYGHQFDVIFTRQLLTMFDFRDINNLMAAAQQLPPDLQDGNAAQPENFSPENFTDAQAIRAAVNSPVEG